MLCGDEMSPFSFVSTNNFVEIRGIVHMTHSERRKVSATSVPKLRHFRQTELIFSTKKCTYSHLGINHLTNGHRLVKKYVRRCIT